MNAEQLAKLIDHTRRSRRRGKKFLHDHGGEATGAALDRALAEIDARPDRDAIYAAAAALTAARELHERRAAEQRAEDAERAQAAREFGALAAAADRDWERVARLVEHDVGWISDQTEERREAILRWGRAPDTDAIVAALEAADLQGALSFDWHADRAMLWRAVQFAVQSAAEELLIASAVANCAAAATQDGRWAVATYYRKTLGDAGGLQFDEREDAVDYYQLAHDPSDYGNRTSAYGCEIFDTQPAEAGQHA